MQQIIYLEPRSLFPSQILSDTVYNTICIGYKDVFGVNELNEFIEKKPILISSTFPYIKNDKIEHFFPKLITKPPELTLDEIISGKVLKKVKFIHENIFNEWINGKISEKGIIENFDSYRASADLLFPKNINIDFSIKPVDRTHNQKNRLNPRETSFFYSNKTFFKNSGLYFILKYLDESFKENINSIFNYLTDRGFGGNISVGEGQFKPTIKEIELIKEPEDGEYFVTLSLFCPTEQEIESFNKENTWYELIKREGKMTIGKAKKSLFMFKEGSTFPSLDQTQYGKIECVSNNPIVFEYGYAFPVKVRKNEM